MCAAVKVIADPARRFDRAVEVGLSASFPRNAAPLMLVIRTNSVSNDAVWVRKVSRTKSPT